MELLGCNNFGTRIIHKLLEKLKSVPILLEEFDNSFKENLIIFTKNPHSTHIIAKYTSTYGQDHNNFIYEIVFEQLAAVSKDKNGCCVVQKLIENGSSSQKVRMYVKFNSRTI